MKVAVGAEFSPRFAGWSDVEWGVVQSMHWWHNVKCDGPISGKDATGTVDCTSVDSGTWPEPFGNESYAGPGPGDGYWGSWAWKIKAVDPNERRIAFAEGGHQTTRGALNAGPWHAYS